MLQVEIVPIQESLVLRARGSELLILPLHVKRLKGLKTPKEFSNYFINEAMVNRPARKLFEAWLRKDGSLWPRIFKTIHEVMEVSADEIQDIVAKPAPAKKSAETTSEKAPATKSAEKSSKPAAAKAKAAEVEEEDDSKPAKKVAKKKTSSASEDKPVKKAAKKAATSDTTKKKVAKKKSK